MIYISGPMTGLPNSNYDAFTICAIQLRSLGHEVLNPAEHFEGRQDLPRHKFLAADVVSLVQQCKEIVLLQGWEQSEGSKLEAQIGIDLGYQFYAWYPLWATPANWKLNTFVVSREDVEARLDV